MKERSTNKEKKWKKTNGGACVGLIKYQLSSCSFFSAFLQKLKHTL